MSDPHMSIKNRSPPEREEGKWLGQLTTKEALERMLVPVADPVVLGLPQDPSDYQPIRKVKITWDGLRNPASGYSDRRWGELRELREKGVIDSIVGYVVGGNRPCGDSDGNLFEYVAVQFYRRTIS